MMRLTGVLILAATGAGCSIRSLATESVADALSGNGGVFAQDGDPELVRDAVPFGLKTYESLLADLPEHKGLLLALAGGFTQYAYAFVMEDADRLDAKDLARARELRARARGLFIRGRNFALRGLEVEHPGFVLALKKDRSAALAELTVEDVPFLYWAGASWAAAIMSAKDDLDLVAELPLAGVLLHRVLELDETYNKGAIHELLISYEGGRPEAMGGSAARARVHYARALELSGGLRASVHLALAEAVSVREQNLREFRRLVSAAGAVDPEADPDQRLVNVISRRRAAWLQSRIPDLFLDDDSNGGKQ